MVSVVGVLCGLAGMQHGVGETLQGNVAPSGIIINAWQPAHPLFGPEPALTIVPNFFVTGVLAVIFGLMVAMWSVAFVQGKKGGAVLILLSIVQFFVGGGIAPLLPAIMVGVAATRINSPLTWWRAHLPVSARRALAKLWLWSVMAFSFLYSLLLFFSWYLFSENIDLAFIFGDATLGLILFSVFAGFAYDIQRRSVE